jgi:DNA-binding NarL/FixJ family response regulator
MIKVILVDDHKIILDSLKMLLASVSTIEIVSVFQNSNEVCNYLEHNEVDIVITDAQMPQLSGIDLGLKIRNSFPNIKTLLLTMIDTPLHIKDAIKAGVHGYILKKLGKEELVNAINTLMSGKKYFSEEVIDQLSSYSEEDLNDVFPEHITHLTSREIEIIKLIASENSTPQIASKLYISTTTVETHRANIMKKLNVKTSIGVTKYAIKHHLIEN